MSTLCNCHGIIFLDCPNYRSTRQGKPISLAKQLIAEWGLTPGLNQEDLENKVAKLLERERALARLHHAIEWELKPESSLSAGDEIRLVRRDGFKGRRWGIYQRGYVLNKSGKWEWEPQPSSRTEEWLDTVRWATPEEAESAWQRLERAAKQGEEGK